jgi:hypothetical protein
MDISFEPTSDLMMRSLGPVRDTVAGETVLDLGYGTARIAEHSAQAARHGHLRRRHRLRQDKYRRGNLDYVAVPPVQD